MSLDRLPENLREPVRAIASRMFEEGAKTLYVATNGKRVYVGTEPATKFRDKEGAPDNVEITPEDL